MAPSQPRATVCVTGGSGFLGSWCVKLLLDKGYTVHTTVRSASKCGFLKALPGADERLIIFDGVDLLVPDAFSEAFRGCSAVLHTASPFFMTGGSEEALVTPALEGTRNVLSTCAALGIKQVVLTSSTAAVYVMYGKLPDDHVYTDADWSDEAAMRERKAWYPLSKLVAEKLAWEICKESGIDLAVLNPTWILGPNLPGQPHLNTSSNAIVAMMDGSAKQLDNACKTYVDVRDVAEAHIAPLEAGGAAWGKRFLLIGGCPHQREVASAVRDAVPAELKANVPTAVSDVLPPHVMGQSPPNPILYDVSPAEKILGIDFRGVEEMVKSAVDGLLDNGHTSTAMFEHSPGRKPK